MSYQLKIVYIGIYYLLDCDYLEQYEVGLTALHFIIYEDRLIPVDILGYFNKIVGNIINLKQVERITCKNVFFAVVAKVFLKMHIRSFCCIFYLRLQLLF